ncbi:MAG: CRISPR-associated endonuclease Cas3'' [Methylobacter sp.]
MTYFKYWGKASADEQSDSTYHLLPYHCLDVAAVADIWWRQSRDISRCFTKMTGLNEQQTRAWLLFIIALHDYGKFDLRFQRKALDAWKAVNAELSVIPIQLNGLSIKEYNHGPAGLYWFYQDLKERFLPREDDFYADDNEDWTAWRSWLTPVVGHHGVVPQDHEKDHPKYQLHGTPQLILDAFKQSRQQWLVAVEQLFLIPAALSLNDTPPLLETTKNGQSAATMLA